MGCQNRNTDRMIATIEQSTSAINQPHPLPPPPLPTPPTHPHTPTTSFTVALFMRGESISSCIYCLFGTCNQTAISCKAEVRVYCVLDSSISRDLAPKLEDEAASGLYLQVCR